MTRRLAICSVVILATVLAVVGAASVHADGQPQFRFGFKTLADLIPDVVGVPLEDEHYTPEGDSQQRTTTGLMVWRKATNYPAFTNGWMTWVLGPYGLQVRANDERFDWEQQVSSSPAPSTATPTPAPTSTVTPNPTPTPTATPAPTASSTPAPKLNLQSSQPNVIQGQGLDAYSIWVLGELTNKSAVPAYNVRVTARLLNDSGTVVGTANQAFAYLGPGDTVGYCVEVKNVTTYARAEVSADASTTGFASFAKLQIGWVKNEQSKTSNSLVRYEFTGTLNNNGSQPVALNAVYVWFLDDQNRVVWMDTTYVPDALAPGDSHTFLVRTPWSRENSQVSGITQVRYYAAGQLP